jgi:hypothetical protein
MLHHVTYHVKPGALTGSDIKVFMSTLGFRETDPSVDGLEDGWNVRWFERGWPRPSTKIHFVEGAFEVGEGRERHTEHFDRLALGHFCVRVGRARYGILRGSQWCVRDSGSGRIWLAFSNLRVEVRP